jgi:hypothetical protein
MEDPVLLVTELRTRDSIFRYAVYFKFKVSQYSFCINKKHKLAWSLYRSSCVSLYICTHPAPYAYAYAYAIF